MLDRYIWIWKEPDCRWKNKILNLIKDSGCTEKDIVMLHCNEVEGFDSSIPLANFALRLSEKFGFFQRERTMFLNPKDLAQAFELCLDKLARKTGKEAEITDEDIIKCHEDYLDYLKWSSTTPCSKVAQVKTFIEESNCADLWLILHLMRKSECKISEHLSQKKYLILGIPQSEVVRNLISVMTAGNDITNIIVETPLNISLEGSPPSSSIPEVTTELIDVNDISCDVKRLKESGSATEEYVEDIIVSFLSLLINSRNELALSKVMISPVINLSHEAFTELRHLSEEKEMAMCQTALSYVTRLQLGGKGYAPPKDCPLLPHLKKLEAFVNVLNQMQTLVEEDPTPVSAVKKLINILKKKLFKSGSDKLRVSSIESASENLKEIAVKMSGSIYSEACKMSAPQVCQDNLDFIHQFVNYVNCCCLTSDPRSVLLLKQTKRTPINLPPLMGYFRSPEDESSVDIKSTADEDSLISNRSTSVQKYIPYFHCSDSSSVTGICVDSSTPPKTSFKGCLPNESCSQMVLDSPKASKKLAPKKGRKRKILGEITNEKSPCGMKKNTEDPKKLTKAETQKASEEKMKPDKNNPTRKADMHISKASQNKEPRNKKTKTSKKLKLIEGQGKITSFFTMK